MKTTASTISTFNKESLLPEDEALTDKLRNSFFPSYVKVIGNMVNAAYKVAPKTACKAAMTCFTMASRKRMTKSALSFYETGKKSVSIVNNRPFYTYSFGKGPKVLLVHGWSSYGYRWDRHVSSLVAKGYECIVVDAPGHGTSPGKLLSVPDFISCIRHVLVSEEKWHSIISHSMGSLVSMIALSETKLQLASNKFVMMNTFSDCNGLLTRYGKCIGFSDRLMVAVKDWISDWTGKPLSYFSMIERAENLNLDIQLIFDTHDIVVPYGEPVKIINGIHITDVMSTSNKGHGLHQPEVTDRIVAFVTEGV